MRPLLGAVLLLGIVSSPGPAAEPKVSEQGVERTRALVEAGVLPRNALQKAEQELERKRLSEELRATLAKSELTETELDDMLRSTERLRDLARERLAEVQTVVDAGAAPANALQPVKDELDSASRIYELVKMRAKLVGELAAMVRAEDRFDELVDEELAFSSEGTGGGEVWFEDILALDALFQDYFGRVLPLSAEGDTLLHRSLGFDHSGRYDVALYPDDEDGQFVIGVLSTWGVPYIAFRSAVPGQSTGPHIHIGPPSERLPAEDEEL